MGGVAPEGRATVRARNPAGGKYAASLNREFEECLFAPYCC
jgi:hypothetical protein